MRINSFLLAISFSLVLAFIFSCSSDDGEPNSTPSSDNSTKPSSSSNSAVNKCGGVDYNPAAYICDSRNEQVYLVVTIGTQIWMAENLNYKVSGSKCYDNDNDNCNTYGQLYDWATAMKIASTYNSSSYTASAKHEGICPSGWHIPSNTEWNVLMTTVGNANKLKAKTGWNGGGGTNESGFTALPGGYFDRAAIGPGDYDYVFTNIGYWGDWWSSTEWDSEQANGRMIGNSIEDSISEKFTLKSVRCIKNN